MAQRSFSPRTTTSLCHHCRDRLLPTSSSPSLTASRRHYSSQQQPIELNNATGQHSADNAESMPRWLRTPAAMRAPFRIRPKNDNDTFPCNEDPAVLDAAYRSIFGRDGHTWLTDEVKWLAVTHKSFDHGRQGFNDRLAFLGKRIIDLQASLSLLQATPTSTSSPNNSTQKDTYGRSPFQTPSTVGLENITPLAKAQLLEPRRLAQLAQKYGLTGVIRWKPRQTRNMLSSGLEAVLAETIYAIVGAVAMQRGGEQANAFVRNRILGPLATGLR